ncbi:MAG: MMPL family transporter, partial [Solirubrobacterales bacterium]|nr:MMPL family transporter [Solirubrobacterales bacterium]
MTSITHLSLRHRRLVALAWVALTVVGVLTVSSATGRLSHNFNTPGTAGYDANAHIIKSLDIDGNEQPTIAVLHLPAGDGMGAAAGRAAATRTFAAATRAGPVAVADYANTHNSKLISHDGQTTWALIDVPNPDVGAGQGVVDRIGPALRAAAPAGVSVSMTGFEQIQSNGGGGGSGPSVLLITVIGALGALAVLLFVYASAVAVVPLLVAIPSILTTFLLVLGLEQAISVNFLVEYLVAVMGLGVAVDYSLLLITRWREERDAGRSNEQAILAAGPTAGRAVVLSGATVAVGLLSLVVLPVPFLRSIGLAGM